MSLLRYRLLTVMQAVTYYGIDESLNTIEHGVITKEDALQVVKKFAAIQPGLHGSAEEALAKSMFGFSIDAKRFIEIAMETDANFRVKLEMPGRLWGVYQKETPIVGLPKLREIIDHFFTMPLDEFKNYFETVQPGRQR